MKTKAMGPTLCPSCGKPLPAGILAGFCPVCLMAQGAETVGSGEFKPPSLEEVAGLFPQLEVRGLLGAGGMGAVYQARQPALDRMVALKILPAAGGDGARFAERFNREARALARLNHPNVVAVYEFGQAGDLHYFLMEFVDGSNLRQLERAGRLSPRQTLQLIPQICDALQYAHDQGVVHRDIKPENVLVDRQGRVKIADFGLAKILGHDTGTSRLTAEGQVMGTPHYMAPEQLEHPLAVDHRADIYSLGVVIYEMLTGDLPIGRFSPPSRKVQVDVRFDEVVLRALENDPACRYQRASEVKSRVEIISDGPGQTSTAASALPPLRSVTWAGFPVVVESHGVRRVNWPEVLRAWAILFGLFTLVFGWVSAVTGVSLLGWIGIIGWPSLIPRAGAAVALVGWGVWKALSRPWDEPGPHTGPVNTTVPPAIPWWRSRRMILPLVVLLAGAWTVLQDPWMAPRVKALLGLSTRRVSQLASINPENGALIARLPRGGTVELLALSDGKTSSNTWWRPNGSPFTSHRFDISDLAGIPLRDVSPRYLVFRGVGLPQDAGFPQHELEPVADSSSGGAVYRDGRPMMEAWPMAVGWPESASTGLIRLGYGLDPWRTAVIHRVAQGSVVEHRRPGDPAWSASLNHVAEDGRDLLITMVLRPETPDWQTRVTVVDTQGNTHTYSRANGNPGNDGATWTYAFTGMTKEELLEVRFQVRPVDWIEFRHVPLTPLPTTRPSGSTIP